MFDASATICSESVKPITNLTVFIKLECGGLNQYRGLSMFTSRRFILKLENTM
jgi:hypothetical protein